MKITDWLVATQNKWPYQNLKVCPVQHYDDLEGDGSHDYVATMIVGNRQVAYRVTLETALKIDGWVNQALRCAVENGKPVSIFTAKPENETDIQAR